MVLLFSDLKKAQIYKIRYRDSPHHEIERLMSLDYLHLFGPDGKADDRNFLFEIEHRKYIHVGEKIISFDTDDEIEGYIIERDFNDIKFPFAHGKENIYFMLHQKYIPLQEYEKSIMKNEYRYLYKKDKELKSGNITVENESKSQECNMTMSSRAFDEKVFEGNTILLKISEENQKHKYVYIGGDMVCSFMSSDNI